MQIFMNCNFQSIFAVYIYKFNLICDIFQHCAALFPCTMCDVKCKLLIVICAVSVCAVLKWKPMQSSGLIGGSRRAAQLHGHAALASPGRHGGRRVAPGLPKCRTFSPKNLEAGACVRRQVRAGRRAVDSSGVVLKSRRFLVMLHNGFQVSRSLLIEILI